MTPGAARGDRSVEAIRRAAAAAGDWAALAAAVRDCTACAALAGTRTSVVVGAFPAGVDVALLGEAPGAEEDAKGEPFVGRSGQLLDRLLADAGLGRDRVAVVNVLKCRPPGNRKPLALEVARCRGWLDRQLDLIDPLVVVALGGTAVENMLGRTAKVTRVRGRDHVVGDRLVVATYHPSAALRWGPGGEPLTALAADLRHAAERAQELRRCGVRFRAARVDDAAELLSLTVGAYLGHPPLEPPSGVFRETVDDVAADLEADGGIVGVREGKLVAGLRFDRHGGQQTPWVRRVAVAPQDQGRGVGRQLIAWAEAVARSAGHAEMRLGVRMALPGNRRFYEHLGYTPVADHPHDGTSGPLVWTELSKQLAGPVA